MPRINTLGPLHKRTEFTYTGSVTQGASLEFTGRPNIAKEFFHRILEYFAGQDIPGGFNPVNPTPGGLGEWIMVNSRLLNAVKLSPRHGSFIAAILVHEGYIDSSLRGNAVWLQFPPASLYKHSKPSETLP